MPKTKHAALSPTALMDRLRLHVPADFAELIGPAAKVARILHVKVLDARADGHAAPFRHILYGPPGSGKTLLANILARMLAGDPLAVQDIAGTDVDVDTIRGWEAASRLGALFGDWQVQTIQELDKMPPLAQVRMLQYMDKLPPKHAVIATSNLEIGDLQQRLQSRAQAWKIMGPESDEIRQYLLDRWPLPEYTASMIAVGAGGNLRQALLDAQTALDAQRADALLAA